MSKFSFRVASWNIVLNSKDFRDFLEFSYYSKISSCSATLRQLVDLLYGDNKVVSFHFQLNKTRWKSAKNVSRKGLSRVKLICVLSDNPGQKFIEKFSKLNKTSSFVKCFRSEHLLVGHWSLIAGFFLIFVTNFRLELLKLQQVSICHIKDSLEIILFFLWKAW